MQIAQVSQLFLGYTGLAAGLAEVDREALLGSHRLRSSQPLTEPLQTRAFIWLAPAPGSATFLEVIAVELSRTLCAETVEQCPTVCYTRATNWTSAERSAAKEES